jgi:hypothetical protein
MNKKSIKIIKQNEEAKRDLAYWLSKPASKRLEAVDILRKQSNGSPKRFQRTIRIIKQARS